MRTLFAYAGLWLTIGAGFWFALSSTMNDMTRRDCQLGSQRACIQLAKDGQL
jgi:hypothetical protein